MKGRLYLLGLMLILGAVVVSGCVPPTAQPTEVPMSAPTEVATAQPTELPTATPTEAAVEAPDGVRAARDVALAYVSGRYGEQAPALGLTWMEEFITPEGLVGSGTYQYTAGDWVVTISYPIVAPEAVIYQVVVVNQTTGFRWEGEVDAAGQVTETRGQPVVGWLGHVVSTPDGAQYDDYLVLQPEGVSEIGVEGIDEAIEAEIVALRDKEEPGKYAHFWGTLVCDVPDYGGCQLLVTRLRYGQTFTDPELIEAWEGVIISNPPGAQFDDYFLLAGDFPVGYGIDSLDPTVAAQLEGLRDTGITARVWGQLRTGVPDAYGSQIEVTRVEGVGDPLAPTPTPQGSATEPPEVAGEAVEGWMGTIVKLPPGNQFGHYFERDDGERFDVGSADASVTQQINEARWTGAQIRVWGRLFTGVPAVEARHIEVERIEVLSGPAEEARDLTPFATTSASSHLPTDRGGQYQSWMATDGALETSWVEGVAGPGIGEWIELRFPATIEVHSIRMDVGYDRDADIFAKNNRIKKVTLIFSNGEEVELGFADARGMQTIPLVRAPGPNIETTYVKAVIEEVFPGSKYDDTCLAEIEVWGRTR
jgi:hypothetical protein